MTLIGISRWVRYLENDFTSSSSPVSFHSSARNQDSNLGLLSRHPSLYPHHHLGNTLGIHAVMWFWDIKISFAVWNWNWTECLLFHSSLALFWPIAILFMLRVELRKKYAATLSCHYSYSWQMKYYKFTVAAVLEGRPERIFYGSPAVYSYNDKPNIGLLKLWKFSQPESGTQLCAEPHVPLTCMKTE